MSDALRWMGFLLLRGAAWWEHRLAVHSAEAWPHQDLSPRIFELRTRIHCGDY